MINPRRFPARSVHFELNAKNTTNVEESRVDNMPVGDEDCAFKGAGGLVDIERVGVRGWFQDLQNSCRVKRRKVPDAVAEVVELADKLVQLACGQGAQVVNIVTPEVLPSEGTEFLFLSVSLKNSRRGGG